MPEVRPWGMLFSFGEVFLPYAFEALMSTAQYASLVPPPGAILPQATITFSALLIHTIP